MEDVDVERTKEVVVSRHGEDNGKDGGDSSKQKLATGEPDLPEGAVTRFLSQETIDNAENQWDPLIEVAEKLVEYIDENITDYKAVISSQVRLEDKLFEPRVTECKIRHKHTADDGVDIPFSVYTKFLKPKQNIGVEAIWVDGWHQGNICAHGPGLLNVKRLYLDPEGPMAMDGNRYPIWVIGFRNLLIQMIENARKEREHGECQIVIKRNVDVNGIKCTTLEAIHPEKREHFSFHIARIYIDDERNIPIGYEGFLWPEKEGEDPVLLEYYFYTDVELNPGLKAVDFQADNESYNYPKW